MQFVSGNIGEAFIILMYNRFIIVCRWINKRNGFFLQTMVGLVDGVVKLIKTEFGYDLLDALMGFENASKVINTLLTNSSAILTGK